MGVRRALHMMTFSALLALCAGNSPVTGESPHKGQWRRALVFSLICAWINGWLNNREAGYLRRHRAHYDVAVMVLYNDIYTVCGCIINKLLLWIKITFPTKPRSKSGGLVSYCCYIPLVSRLLSIGFPGTHQQKSQELLMWWKERVCLLYSAVRMSNCRKDKFNIMRITL